MATISLLCGILFWVYIWNKWYRPHKPKPVLDSKPRPMVYDAEEREAIHDEVLLQMVENGESPEDAMIIAQTMVQITIMIPSRRCSFSTKRAMP